MAIVCCPLLWLLPIEFAEDINKILFFFFHWGNNQIVKCNAVTISESHNTRCTRVHARCWCDDRSTAIDMLILLAFPPSILKQWLPFTKSSALLSDKSHRKDCILPFGQSRLLTDDHSSKKDSWTKWWWRRNTGFEKSISFYCSYLLKAKSIPRPCFYGENDLKILLEHE